MTDPDPTASHTSDYFAVARRLGEALALYLNYQPSAMLLKLP